MKFELIANEEVSVSDTETVVLVHNKPNSHHFCQVCGDWSTGKHYGCFTCYGCRAFFQRVVRIGASYTCKFRKNCDVSKRQRDKCRYCRFQKCVKEGMKKGAVQQIKDTNDYVMQQTQFSIHPEMQQESSIIAFLLLMERNVKEEILGSISPSFEIMSIQEVYDSYKNDIYCYTEWAKKVLFFRDLEVSDQLALIKAHGADILIFESIRRSIRADGFKNIPHLLDEGPFKEFADYGHRVHIMLQQPFNSLSPSDSEFILLKALILLDPAAKGLSESGRRRVESLRYQMQLLLEGLTLDKEPGRLSTMLLLLATLFHVAEDARKLTEIVQRSGVIRMPKLVEEVVILTQ